MNARIVWACLMIGCATQASSAFAQNAPPSHGSSSPEGVSYRSGTFSYSETDLSIGGPGSQGLTLTRIYNSSIEVPDDIYYATRGWTESLQGWTGNHMVPPEDPDPLTPPPHGSEPYEYTVSFGGKSYAFSGGSQYQPGPYGSVQVSTGGPIGTYSGEGSLVYDTTATYPHYIFTSPDGTVVNFTPTAGGRMLNAAMPDGTRLDYTYTPGMTLLKSIISNRGYAILVDSETKVCAVNMAQTYVTATSTCPSDAQTVTYGYTSGSYSTSTQLLTAVTKSGRTTTYSYVGADHLGCIKEPGQSVCKIQNTYGVCPNDPADYPIQPQTRRNDPVISQIDGAGRTIAYTYNFMGSTNYAELCPYYGSDPYVVKLAYHNLTTTRTVNGTQITTVVTDTLGQPVSVTDPLGRVTQEIWDTYGPYQFTYPEGNIERWLHSGIKVTGHLQIAKPGSALANIGSTASYSSTCTNIKTCIHPDYTVDANGNRTDFTYDSAHGGVLTETAPANMHGVRAVKRYAYVQRYAWIKNSGGGFSHASSPVWVLSEMRTCINSATVSGACAAGSNDEVVTIYDYGPDTGAIGNTLLLRGTAVTAGGQTLRTCHGYDRDGNEISQTTPRGTTSMTVCP
jgi:YD repeat-containing protein